MEGTSIALPAIGAVVGRAATSGQRVPIQLPALATWTSTVSTSGRRAASIRRTASQFVASPKDLGSTAKKTKPKGTKTDDRINNLLHKFPFSLPYEGYIDRTTGGWGSRGTYGFFWSEGASSDAYARYLSFSGVDVWPENGYYKTYGFPVRCVAKRLRVQGANSATDARLLDFNGVVVWPEYDDYKTRGYPVRCVAKLTKSSQRGWILLFLNPLKADFPLAE